jgi:hypothetical protein
MSAEKVSVNRLCHVPKHGDEGTQIVVCARDDGALIVVETKPGSDEGTPLREIPFEEALRTAEHALAGNPRAVTWPPAITVLAAAFLASVAYSQKAKEAASEPAEGGT